MTSGKDDDWGEIPTSVTIRMPGEPEREPFPEWGDSVIEAADRVRAQGEPGQFPPLPNAAKMPGSERMTLNTEDRDAHEFFSAARGTSANHKQLLHADGTVDFDAAAIPLDMDLGDDGMAFVDLRDTQGHYDLSASSFDFGSGLGLAESAFDDDGSAPLPELPHAPNLTDVLAAIDEHGFKPTEPAPSLSGSAVFEVVHADASELRDLTPVVDCSIDRASLNASAVRSAAIQRGQALGLTPIRRAIHDADTKQPPDTTPRRSGSESADRNSADD